MAADSNTVVGLKSAFLRTQTRILSQPLQAPEYWKDEAGEIPQTVIKDVMREANRLVRRHNKAAYSSLSIRHVAEQIDKLYWDAGAPDLDLNDPAAFRTDNSIDNDDEDTIAVATLTQDTDLTLDAAIAALPDTWDDADTDATTVDDPTATAAYAAAHARLTTLVARRQALRQRLARYARLRELLEPLRDPLSNVQPNLATRDAKLAAELSNARTLGVRVAARVGEWVAGKEGSEDVDADGEVWVGEGEGEGEKLRKILAG